MKTHHAPFRVSLAASLLLSAVLTSSAWATGEEKAGLIVPAPATQELEQVQEKEQKALPAEASVTEDTKLNVPETAAVVEMTQKRFFVDTINVQNATLLSADELATLTKPYTGREITLAELETLVEGLNHAYRSKGYLTSQAFVPPQEVQNKTVNIQVQEGHVGKICITGNRFYRDSVILNTLHIKEGDLFNIRDLEADLNRANRDHSYQLKAVLSPGANTGETDLRLEAMERQPWQVTPTFDNQGRPYIGTMRAGAEITNESLLGYGDRLSTKYLAGAGTQVGLGSYFFPVGKRGDEIGLSYGYSHVDVDLDTVSQNEIIGKSHNIGLLWSHPFDRDRVWTGDLGFNWRRVLAFSDSSQTNRDDIRSLQAGLNYNKFDRLGRTIGRAQSTVGIGFLGGDAEFWKNELYLTRLFRLPYNNVLMLRAYGQYSSDALPSAEAFQLGGAYSVRGYTEGLLLGDRGYSLTVEDRMPIPFLKHVSPWLNDRLQGAVFVDFGQAFLDSSNSTYIGGLSGSAQRTTLLGAGFGLRARLTQYLQGFVDFGFGLLNRGDVEPNAQPTMRIHFGIRSNLLPETLEKRSTEVRCKTPKS